MSRTQAKLNLTLDDFRSAMAGIYTTSVNVDTLDEAPGAYKDFNMIKETVRPTIDIVELIKPEYNLKAGEV
jgi:RNA-splicing ligase RtcB